MSSQERAPLKVRQHQLPDSGSRTEFGRLLLAPHLQDGRSRWSFRNQRYASRPTVMTHSCRLATVTALLCSLLTGVGAAAAQRTRYLLFTAEHQPAGEQLVERGDDGLVNVRYVFKDNGRGPELREQFRLAADGTFSQFHVTGSAEMGGPVDESFVRNGDQASWRSPAEHGSATAGAAGSFYVPRDNSWEVVSASIAAVASRPDGRLPLLPSGTLSQTKVDEVELTSAGQTQRLQLLAQTGLGFSPSFYWATMEARPRLFAALVPGWQLAIEEGWESDLEMLEQRQRSAAAVFLKQLAATLAKPLPGVTVVRNARVFDSKAARLGQAADVYVFRGNITAVLPAGTAAQAADTQIDAAGRVLLPGLFDMHGHSSRWDGGLHLAAGVTTVRDMGSNNVELQQVLNEIDAGTLLWPRVVPCGFLEGDSPFSSSLGIKIKTLVQAKAAIDWYAARGYPQLKIYNSFPREHLRETVAYAKARGMRVSGHVPAFLRAQDVVELGFDEIQHINQVMLNFLVTPTTDTRTLERFVLPAQRLASFDTNARPAREFIALLTKHHTVIDPTLVGFEFMKQRDGEKAERFAAILEHLPPNVQRWYLGGGMKISDDATAARYKASYAKMAQFVGQMYKAGVPLVAGTDDLAGFGLHSELASYVKTGMTASQALQIATLNGARYSGTLHDRGSITPGKFADLVLIDGDPTRDIADLRKVAMVITQGKLLWPTQIHQALGVAPFVQWAPAVTGLAANPTP